MIVDVLAHGIKDLSPWCMIFADDIVLCNTRREEIEKKLEEKRRALEGLKISRKKTIPEFQWRWELRYGNYLSVLFVMTFR